MSEVSMFEQAVRLKVRFDTSKGRLSAEDLFDLPLTSVRSANLNDIAKDLNRELKAVGEEDFVNPSAASMAGEELKLKFEIVKYVIAIRLAENAAARAAVEKKEKKVRLLEIIARKQDAALEGAPLEELQKMVAEL